MSQNECAPSPEEHHDKSANLATGVCSTPTKQTEPVYSHVKHLSLGSDNYGKISYGNETKVYDEKIDPSSLRLESLDNQEKRLAKEHREAWNSSGNFIHNNVSNRARVSSEKNLPGGHDLCFKSKTGNYDKYEVSWTVPEPSSDKCSSKSRLNYLHKLSDTNAPSVNTANTLGSQRYQKRYIGETPKRFLLKVTTRDRKVRRRPIRITGMSPKLSVTGLSISKTLRRKLDYKELHNNKEPFWLTPVATEKEKSKYKPTFSPRHSGRDSVTAKSPDYKKELDLAQRQSPGEKNNSWRMSLSSVKGNTSEMGGNSERLSASKEKELDLGQRLLSGEKDSSWRLSHFSIKGLGTSEMRETSEMLSSPEDLKKHGRFRENDISQSTAYLHVKKSNTTEDVSQKITYSLDDFKHQNSPGESDSQYKEEISAKRHHTEDLFRHKYSEPDLKMEKTKEHGVTSYGEFSLRDYAYKLREIHRKAPSTRRIKEFVEKGERFTKSYFDFNDYCLKIFRIKDKFCDDSK